ncbi:MAG: AmmeMemoRadiSam system protein B [Proteobacteria bacterium]|nr:AmmeMemoRadiSam system protein B [Pseudomonadota bacterium]MBU2227475.1 AmmeMemoRadiSam system protein B [Pseudomonadota bacterium]MBU2262337.1 AmmeMemoRadiSam system protein B [Pseudomonadota bacterium]
MTTLPFGLPFVVLGLGLTVASPAGGDGGDIRPAAVAGRFYPESASALRLAVEKFMRDALPALAKEPLAIVVPHAGYIYSGQICADGYSQIRDRTYDTVVILGTNHTTPSLRKIALYPDGGFRTPLGTVPVDGEAVSALIAACPDCKPDRGPHLREHSLEVQIPFIQILFPQAKIIPAIVGEADVGLCTRFGAALAKVLKGRRALIVASSDLSHYPSADDAAVVDRKTLEAITTLNPATLQTAVRSQMARRIPNLSTCACGEAPIMAAMAAAKALGAQGGRIVSYAHSGDIPVGERDRVVGYGAVVLGSGLEKVPASAPTTSAAANWQLSPEDKKALLTLARETISRYLSTQTVPLPRGFSPAAMERRGIFVTLKKRGNLRGCIGRMIPDRPLATLVGTIALQSAFEDSRFSPVTPRELPDLKIDISVLTPMKPIPGPAEIVVGRDGVLLQKGGRSAVFLPQVAPEQGWGRDEMLNHLSQKAGLPAGAWREGAQFSTFQALVFGEGGP